MPELGSAIFTIKTNAKEFFGDLKKAEAEANAAARSVGAAFHKMAAGVDDSSESVHGLTDETEQATQETKKFGDETERTTGKQRRNREETDKQKNEITGLWKEMRKLNIIFQTFGNIVKVIKWPAIIAGASAALTAVNGLAAGLVGLTSALSAAAPAVVTFVQGFAAAKQAIAVFKFGISGVSDSLKDVKKSFNQPTAAAKEFAAYLNTFTPQLKRLRSEAQKPLLAGLTKGLSEAKSVFPVVHAAVKATSVQLASLAVQAGKTVSVMGPQLGRVTQTNARLVGNLGRAGINLAASLVTVLDQARPLSQWLGKMVEGWSEAIREWTTAAAKGGDLTSIFSRTRIVLSHLFSITGALATAFKNIFKAAWPLGHDLLVSIDHLAEHWAKWTGSVQGQNAMKKWFDEARPILHETWLLVHDVVVELFKFGDQPGVANLIAQLRTQLLPVLVTVLRSTQNSGFLSVLIKTISDFGTALTPLIGAGGPLILFIKALDWLAQAMIAIQQTSPAAAKALGLVGSSLGILGALGIARLVSQLAGIRGGLTALKSIAGGVSTAFIALKDACILTRVQLAALWVQEKVAAAGAKIMAAAQWLLNAAMTANPIGLVVVGLAALGAAVYLAYKKITPFREAVDAAWKGIKTGIGATIDFARDHWKLILSILTGPIGAAVIQIASHWKAIKRDAKAAWDWLSSSASNFAHGIADKVSGAFRSVVGTVAGFINKIIDVINILPGVNIGHVSVATSGGGSRPAQANLGGTNHLARGGVAQRGGQVNQPTIIMGEEAPTHPEWVIPENPSYRKRALSLWAAAGKRIGAYARGGEIQGFSLGGAISGAAGAVGGAVKDAAGLLAGGFNSLKGALPKNPLTGWASGLGSYILHQVGGFIKSKIPFIGGGPGGSKGPDGVGSFMGVPMANWVIDSLKHAQSKGVAVRPTSGYRPGFDRHTATGASEHQGTKYPHGAVDFGGYHDSAALAMKMAVVGATNGYKYPLLAPIGFVDDGHASGTGHYMGGVIGKNSNMLAFASGGVYSREALMQLWDRRGGDPGRANVAAAVALAESSGRVNASNTNSDGSTDRGLWQINSVHGALSTFAPGGNADAAIKISDNGRNWNPWTVFRTGAYRKFMGGTLKNPPKGIRISLPGGSGGGVSSGAAALPPITKDQAVMQGLNLGYDQIQARQAYGGGSGKLIKPLPTVPRSQRSNLRGQESLLGKQYQSSLARITKLKKSGASRRKIFDAQAAAQTALQNLNQIRDTIKSVNQQYAGPTPEDKINSTIAQAQVTGDIDKQVLGFKNMVTLREKAYKKAVKAGKPQDIITAAQALVQARADLGSILEQTTGSTELDRANAALAQAGLTDTINDDIQALTTLDSLYYKAYQGAVASGDPRKISEAAANYSQAHQQLQQVTPTAMDYANQSLALAQLTDDWHDDITALTEIDKAAYDAYTTALATNDPKQIAQAAQGYKTAHDALTTAVPSALDYANAQAAQAALTEDVSDDITAAKSIFDIQAQAYRDAVTSGDPRRIAQAAQDYKSARDALDAVQNSGTPSAISFGNVIDPGVLAGIGQPVSSGTVSNVTVQQYFQNPPDDPYAYLRASSFAAQGVFGG